MNSLFAAIACLLVLPTLLSAVKVPGSVKQVEGGCNSTPTELLFGNCPKLCGAFSIDSFTACEQGPPYGCSYNLQPGEDDQYCCEFDPRFTVETVPIACLGDTIVFDRVDIYNVIRSGYVLNLLNSKNSRAVFDVQRSSCYNVVDAVTKRPELPTTIPPEQGELFTTRLYPNPYWICTRGNRRSTVCDYTYTRDGAPAGTLSVHWRNIQGCFPNFSGFRD